MSFNTAWNMAIAFVEQNTAAFRSMWSGASTSEEKVDMPVLQHRLQQAVDTQVRQQTGQLLRKILKSSLQLHPAEGVPSEVFYQGVRGVEELIEEAYELISHS